MSGTRGLGFRVSGLDVREKPGTHTNGERDKHAHDHGERVVSSGEVQKEREERGLGEKKKAKWGLISGNTSQLTNAPTHTNRAQFFVFFKFKMELINTKNEYNIHFMENIHIEKDTANIANARTG